MKKQLILVFLAAVFFCFMPLNDACPANPQTSVSVDGNVYEQAGYGHGDEASGGWATSSSDASFYAEGKKNASGNASVSGEATGSNTVLPNEASSRSSASTVSEAEARGNKAAEVATSGKAEQANWAVVSGDGDDGNLNFATGINTTSGEYEADISGRGITTVYGEAQAEGETTASVVSEPGLRESRVSTTGNSSAYVNPRNYDPKTTAIGEGQAVFQSYLSGGNFETVAGGIGTATYTATGPTVGPSYAEGSLSITGVSTIRSIPNGVQASSSVSSTSRAHAGSER